MSCATNTCSCFAVRSGCHARFMDRKRFEALLSAGASVRVIAEQLGVSESTVRRNLNRLGLRTERMARRGRFDEARRLGLREATGICPRHGETKHVRRTNGVFACSRCSSEAVSRRRRVVKRKLVAEAGGSCRICGYDRCHAALQFHHLAPAAKNFSLGHGGITRGIDQLRREAESCVLLCANCHAEVEVGFATLESEVSVK